MSKQPPLNQPILQAYKVNLSKGDAMPCDADELDKIVLAVKTNAPCKIRSGIFNPSYYVSITEDRERIAEIEQENSTIQQQNEQEYRYGRGENYREYKGLRPIKDIFDGVDLSPNKSISAAAEQKKLK